MLNNELNIKGIKTYVYALIDENDQIFYVGKTTTPKIRLTNHKNSLNRFDIKMKILDYFYDVENYWVNKLLKEGYPLNNKEINSDIENWEIGDIISTNKKLKYKVQDIKSGIIYDSVYKLSKILKIDVGILQYKLSNPERHQDFSQYKIMY